MSTPVHINLWCFAMRSPSLRNVLSFWEFGWGWKVISFLSCSLLYELTDGLSVLLLILAVVPRESNDQQDGHDYERSNGHDE